MFDVFRRRREQNLDEEIRSHLRLATADRTADGVDPDTAARRARREFGSVALVKETTRDIWGGAWLDRLMQDVGYALRAFRRNWLPSNAVFRSG